MIELGEDTLANGEVVVQTEHYEFLRVALPRLRAPVILKTSATQAPRHLDVARLRHEARILRRLGRNAGVAALLNEARTPDGRYGLLLEYGGTPPGEASFFPSAGEFAIERFFTVAVETVRAIAAIHDSGVIHRNLQPSKILVDPQTHQVRLIGFDLATESGTEQSFNPPASALEGALAYISPERTGRFNRPVDYRTDYYSLGVTFYEWLCGSTPFSAVEPTEWVLCHLAKEPGAPQTMRPSVPRGLGDVVLKLLAKQAEERYQSDQALIDDLSRCLEYCKQGRRDDTFALGEQDQPSIFQVSQRIYGRDTERDQLIAHFERAKAGEVELAIVRGTAGVGKSRLVQELNHQAALSRGLFAEANFDEPPSDGTRAPSGLARALEHLCEHLAQKSPPRLARLKRALRSALGRNGQVAVDLVPGLESIIGPQDPVVELPPHRSHNRLLTTFVTLMEAIARPESPVVLALSEAQWVDEGSASLLEFLLAGDSSASLLIVISCRDAPPHAERVTSARVDRLASLRRTLDLRLEPLSPSNVNSLVADSVVRDPARTSSLSDGIYKYTGGSPLLVSLALWQLHREGCICLDAARSAWTWDAAANEALLAPSEATDDLIARITAFDPPTRAHLELAACIGYRFDLQTLSVMAEQEAPTVAQMLDPALRRGVILPTRVDTRLAPVLADHDEPASATYRFSSWALLAAVRAAIEPQRRSRAHLIAGRHRVRGRPSSELEVDALRLAEHFNQAISRLEGPSERELVLRLNVVAAKRALRCATYDAAVGYATVASRLLAHEPDPWHQDHATAHRVFTTLAEALFLGGDEDRALRLLERCITRARTNLERAQTLRRVMYLHLFSGNDQLAFAAVRRALTLLGYRIPATIRTPHLVLEAARAHLALRSTADLVLERTPRLNEQQDRLVVELCAEVTPSVFRLFGPSGTVYLSLRSLRGLPRKGISHEMALPFVIYGLFLVSVVGDTSRGFAFGELGMRLASEDGTRHEFESPVTFAFAHFIKHWRDPLREVVPLFEAAVASGLEHGDHFNASWAAAARAVYAFWSGATLRSARRLFEEANSILSQTRRRGLKASISLGERQLGVLTRTSPGPEHDQRPGPEFEAAELELTLGIPIAIFGEFLLGDLERANHWIQRYETRAVTLARPTASFTEFRFLAALVSLRRNGRAATPSAKKTLRLFVKWEQVAAGNFRCRRALLQAEIARAEGSTWEASLTYNEAIGCAQTEGFIHYQALATEGLAELYLEADVPHLGRPLLRRAVRLYQTWGATAKASVLQQKFKTQLADERATDPVSDTRQWRQDIGRLGSSRRSSGGESTTTRKGPRGGDILEVLEESQSISSETRKDDLIARVMFVTADLTRAHRVLLILQEDDGLEVVAEWSNGETHRLREPAPRYTHLPTKLVIETCGGGDVVVVVDPSESAIPDLPYFSRNQPSSAMCVPVLSQGRSVGGIYAETMGDAIFDRRDVDIAGVIASQAGVSLENARLYEQIRASSLALERTVRERTKKLRSTQRELLERSRQAGMSDVAINVLHNLGNALNGATTSASLLQERVESSEIVKLERAAQMLRQNISDLPAFFASRGGESLTRYLAALAGELEQEQCRLTEEIEHLDVSLEHVREAMAAQWSYARSANVIEPLDVPAVIDHCLMLQRDPSAAEDTGAEYRHDELPEVFADRSKLMQIILNLLSNANEAVTRSDDPQARVWIRTRRTSDATYLIEVRDSGIGIASEALPRLCERGYTTEAGRKGMGLFRAATLAAEMGGAIHVRSDGPGTGAVATVELPIGAPEDVTPTPEASPRPAPQPIAPEGTK